MITVVLLVFMTQQETASGNEGFSPDTPEFLAQDVISQYFSNNSEQPVQIVVTAKDGGDLLTADGLRDYLAIENAITSSEAGALLKDRPGGDILGYFDPVLQALQMRADQMGVTLDQVVAQVTDEQVKQAFLQAYASIPADSRALVDGLYGKNSDLSVPRASIALMVVYLNVSDLNDPSNTQLQAIEVNMADALRQLDTKASDPVAFSFALLFANSDQFQSEIGRLFGEAFLIIVLILLFVFWMSRHASGRYGWVGAWSESIRIGLIVGAAAAVVALALLGVISFWHTVKPTLWWLLPVVAFVVLTVFSVTWARFARWRRAAADMALTMLVILMSIVWMNGIGVLLGPKYLNVIGKFNEILQILPILLIGLGVDYAIHLTSRYREELGAGVPVAQSAVNATRTVGIALILATVTTSVGFLTNVVNPVSALRDFGILAAVGITSAFILMLTVVPAARVLARQTGRKQPVTCPGQALGHQSERVLPKMMGSTAVLAERYAITTLIAALLLGAIGFIGLTQLSTTFSFTDFLPKGNRAPEDLRHDYRRVRWRIR